MWTEQVSWYSQRNEIASEHEVKGSEIIDLAPTILHLMGLRVPQAMNRKVLQTIFAAKSAADRPVIYEQAREYYHRL